MKRKNTTAVVVLIILAAAIAGIAVKRTLSRSYSENHGDVVMIRLGVVNSFLVKGKDRLVIVDTGEYGNENRIIREIQKMGFDPGRVSLIVITHGHLDHYGSASALRRLTGAPIAVHVDDSDYMKRGVYAPVKSVSVAGSIIKFLFIDEHKKIPGVIPDIFIRDDMDLRKYGIEGKVIATPGHTPGSVSVVLDNGDVIVGDAIMDYTGPDYAVFADDGAVLRRSVLMLANLTPKRVFLSHGGICEKSVLKSISRK